jgi:hypothetical protein
MTLNKVATKTVQTVCRGLLVALPFAISAIAQTPCRVSFVPQNITLPASAGNGSFAGNVSGLGTCPFTSVGSPDGWLNSTIGNGASTNSGPIFYAFSFGAAATSPRTGAITVVGGSTTPGVFTNYLIQILQKAATFTQVFDDVPATDSFAEYISMLKIKGVTSGCTTTSFCPSANVTREQMAKFIIISALGTDDFTFTQTAYFEDVPAGSTFFKYVQKMKDLGITGGCSASPNPSLYCPTAHVTRGQMAVLLMRAKFGAVVANSNLLNSTMPYFVDVTASNTQFSFIQKLKDFGITSGCTTTEFCPSNKISRGQAAVMLIRALHTHSIGL